MLSVLLFTALTEWLRDDWLTDKQKLHGAESFFTIRQFLCQWNPSHFIKTHSSITLSKQLSTCSYTERDESNPRPSTQSFLKSSFIILPPRPRSSKRSVSFLHTSPRKTVHISLIRYTYVSHTRLVSSFLVWYPNNILWAIQIMKLFTV